jgi:Ca2+-binding RTX toxin-like protein
VAGQGLAAGIPLPNNGDGILDGSPAGTGEDYPAIAQLKAAIEAANIIPIFAVAGGFAVPYGDLVTQLGRGAYVTLTADSSNVVAAITAGLAEVTRTSIEHAWGGGGDDTIKGNHARNGLEGGLGNDVLDGGADADTLRGGDGNDLYRVDDSGDLLDDSSGRETVEASCDWTLGAGFEHLTLTGAAAHGVGNAIANRIVAAGAGSWLEGLGGNDVLIGGNGADTLDGGVGSDRRPLSRGQRRRHDGGDRRWRRRARHGGGEPRLDARNRPRGAGAARLRHARHRQCRGEHARRP